MFEVYYAAPEDLEREERLLTIIKSGQGHLDFREAPTMLQQKGTVCLTYDFAILEQAETIAQRLKEVGEYVEGPYDYGE